MSVPIIVQSLIELHNNILTEKALNKANALPAYHSDLSTNASYTGDYVMVCWLIFEHIASLIHY